jgi:hypothetical protein
MPSTTRRAFLSTVTTGAVGAVAGCQSLTNDRASLGRPNTTGLSPATLWLDDDVSLPPTVDAETTDTRTDADVAVFPAAVASVNPAIETLAANVPVAVAGDDALATLLAICRGADRSYGFASNGWNSSTDVAGAVPRSETLHTHVFVTADYPDDLPWALGDMLQPATRDCAVPSEHVPLSETARSLGTARVRGYNAVGEFDRRDRVFVRPDSDPTPVFAEMEATIVAGRVGGPTGPYRADRVKTVADFDQRVTDVGPAAQTTDALGVRNVSDGTEKIGSIEFSPRNGAARESFTACQRARLVVDDLSTPFRYTGNARFRWIDPQLLENETFVHHTPGSAAWYPR